MILQAETEGGLFTKFSQPILREILRPKSRSPSKIRGVSEKTIKESLLCYHPTKIFISSLYYYSQ
ncbi:hypothetical protein ACH5RR_041396, partial [Cinchona calisaya]